MPTEKEGAQLWPGEQNRFRRRDFAIICCSYQKLNLYMPICEDVQNTLHKKSRLKNSMCGAITLYFFHAESELSISRTHRNCQKEVLKKVRLENHRWKKGTVNYHFVYPQY